MVNYNNRPVGSKVNVYKSIQTYSLKRNNMKKMEDIYQGSIAINGMYETNDMYRCLVIYKGYVHRVYY